MLPYREIELTNGDTRREPWPHRMAQFVANKFRDEAIAEETALVCARAKTMGREWTGSVSTYDKKNKRYVPDPILCEIQPRTTAITDAARSKWFEFCRTPQDVPDALAYAASPFKKKNREPETADAVVVVADDPVADRPRRGRPPGSKNRSSLAEV